MDNKISRDEFLKYYIGNEINPKFESFLKENITWKALFKKNAKLIAHHPSNVGKWGFHENFDMPTDTSGFDEWQKEYNKRMNYLDYALTLWNKQWRQDLYYRLREARGGDKPPGYVFHDEEEMIEYLQSRGVPEGDYDNLNYGYELRELYYIEKDKEDNSPLDSDEGDFEFPESDGWSTGAVTLPPAVADSIAPKKAPILSETDHEGVSYWEDIDAGILYRDEDGKRIVGRWNVDVDDVIFETREDSEYHESMIP